MKDFLNILMEVFETSSAAIAVAMLAVTLLILVFALVGTVISIVLAIRYVKFNKQKNSIGLSGEKVARKILDDNGLGHIKVSAVGSIMFGNSYSHFFKKVRLRRRTYKKDSLASLAMAAQKSALAVLDKENDADMKRRIALTPIIFVGPIAFIPLLIVGLLIDILIFSGVGICTLALGGIGFLFYVLSFIMSIMVLKTEKKAQAKAYDIMKKNHMATDEELMQMQELFRLYNIEYVNNMILSFLELLLRVLQIVAAVQGGGGKISTSSSD